MKSGFGFGAKFVAGWVAAGMVWGVAPARAAVYDFTYTSDEVANAGFTGDIVVSGGTITSFTAKGKGYPNGSPFDVSGMNVTPDSGSTASYGSSSMYSFQWTYGGYSIFITPFYDGTNINGPNGYMDQGTTTLSAVPEASTWAMMVLGFAGLGLTAYRWRRSSGMPASATA